MKESSEKKAPHKIMTLTYGIDDQPESGSRKEIQAELKEARFINSFMASLCTSLELDEICSIAARTLYGYTPYYRIVFAFTKELDRKPVIFAPMLRGGDFADSRIIADDTPAPSDLHEKSIASAHMYLLDNIGTIAIYFKECHLPTYSESLLSSITTLFTQAVKNALEHGRVKELAMRDALTGLYNRRAFDESLACKTRSSEMLPVSLLLVDLDNFKQVNDRYGHQAGDQVLKTFAKILKESCRGQDIVARFGGEEFAIILSQTSAATAHAIAQRIRIRLAKTVFTFDEKNLQITTSIGLATCRDGSSIFSSNIVRQADQALYQAKGIGKNRVCFFPVNLLTDALPAGETENFGAFEPAYC